MTPASTLSDPRAAFDHVQLTAIIAKPGDDTMETITAQGDTYDNARAALDANLPDGWRMLSIRRW